jgi:hypothetical protein
MIRQGKCLETSGCVHIGINSMISDTLKNDFVVNKDLILKIIHEVKETYKKLTA